MIGCDGWLDGCEDVNLARTADLENRAASVPDVKILFGIECNTRSDPHSLDVYRRGARWSDLMNDAVIAARNMQCSGFIKSQAGSVHQIRDKRLGSVVQIDLVNRDRRFLAA